MKISVIIPTYKPQDYIWECLESLIKQTLSREYFEVILVLNGCCEPWNTDIQKYIDVNMQGMHVNYVQTKLSGVSNARNLALDIAKGQYVTFVDDDDYVSNVYLERLLEAAQSDDTIVLSNTVAFNDGCVNGTIPYHLSNIYKQYSSKGRISIASKVRKYFSGPWMKLIPMTIIQNKRFDVRFKNGEDSLFMLLISNKISYINFSQEDAIYYRRYRDCSAIRNKGTITDKILNSYRLIKEYVIIWYTYKCNFIFFITRVLGAVKSVFMTN